MGETLAVKDTALTDLDYSEATRALVRYWQGLPRPNGVHVPLKADFDLAQLSAHQDELYLSEWYSSDVLTITQSGKSLQRWLGLDLQGHNILALVGETTTDAEKGHYRLLRDQPCGGLITRTGFDVAGTPLLYRTLQLPLLDTRGNVRYFVGTGAALEEPHKGHAFKSIYFTSIHDVERVYFDIGAGLPVPAGQVPA